MHGSSDIPLHVLHDWCTELVAAQTEYLLTHSALAVATTTQEAADAAAKAAKAKANAAAGDVRVTGARLGEADTRQKLTWNQYLGLVSAICLETVGKPNESGSIVLRQSALRDKGKGKARASLYASEGKDEIVNEELGSGVEDDDAMVE